MDNETRRSTLRELRNTPIEPLDAAYPHTVVVPSATYSPWSADAAFAEVYAHARHNTLVDVYRCYELWSLVIRLSHIRGAILEVGTWRGGSGAILASASARSSGEKRVFLCDTFQGVVKAGEKDTLYKGGEHSDTSEETVAALLHGLELTNTHILRGIFPDETGGAIEDRRFSLCHLDVDAYSSAKDTWEWVSPRLSLFGVVVFDDYGFRGCEGVTRLVHELVDDPRFFTFFNLNGHAIMLKIH